MERARVIKRKDGVIQTQHRSDERYVDETLPPGTTPGDVEEQVVVEVTALADVEDVQAQLDIRGGRLVKDLARKLPAQQSAAIRAAAAVLFELEHDDTLPAGVRRYLVALRDALDLGPAQAGRALRRRR